MRPARALALTLLAALSSALGVAHGQDVSLPQVPTTLPPTVISGLIVVRTQLLSRLQAHNQKVDAFNSACGQVQPESALFSQCVQQDKALSAEAATLIEDKKGFSAQLDSALADAKTAALSPEARLRESDRLVIKREIAGIQNALRQLNKSLDLDSSQREEWEKESEHATEDAAVLAGTATLQLLGACADEKVGIADKELTRSVDLLKETDDPDRREQLQIAFKVLKDRRDELQQAKSSIEELQEAYSGADFARNVVEGRTSKTELALQAAWHTGEKLKLIPPQASVLKTYVDLSYLIAVQATSTTRLGDLNSNSEQYLAATKVLKARMETLVKAEKALE